MITSLPLVSILMPLTQDTIYFKAALTSALFQTYDNTEIIIRDNTSTNDMQTMIEKEFLPYYNKIHYIKNDILMNTIELSQKLTEDSKGTYINFLFEKDLFYPLKIERMMQYFLSDKSNTIQFVTSSQVQINEQGQSIQNGDTNRLFTNDTRLNGIEYGNYILQKQNEICELTAPLLRKEKLHEPFGYLRGLPFVHEYITATWLSLLAKGEAIYIADDLSFKRNLPEQKTKNIIQNNEWIQLISVATQLGYLT
ncbi:glycosyltransferase (plasmid) [Bacillus cereus]|uniref:glycosyltransferase n=1 Tax=Bacillus cereus TaxID=1396 RepID=UPI001F1B1E64|nr:glycosyltransferase [Bacillus cereus]UIJ69706.1 glycosyltransferase [Bacillus cereus]